MLTETEIAGGRVYSAGHKNTNSWQLAIFYEGTQSIAAEYSGKQLKFGPPGMKGVASVVIVVSQPPIRPSDFPFHNEFAVFQ